MSGDTPFARGSLAEAAGKDGESDGVEEMLRGTNTFNSTDMTPLTASFEINSFTTALKVPTSVLTGGPIPEMPSIIPLE